METTMLYRGYVGVMGSGLQVLDPDGHLGTHSEHILYVQEGLPET